MKKTTKVKLASFGTAFVLVLGGLLLDARLLLRENSTELEYATLRALGDMTDSVSSLRSTLKKAIYVYTPTLRASVSAKLLEETSAAKAAMASLPLSQEKAERISRFLSQTGDYAMALSGKALRGEKVSQEEISRFSEMGSYAQLLYEALNEAQAHISARDSFASMETALNNVDKLEEIPLLDDYFDETAKEFSDFPELLYDGPFSDHLIRRQPLFLQGMPDVTREEAAETAAKFLSCKAEELEQGGETEGVLPAYVFTREDSRITVTKAGGQVLYFKKAMDAKESSLEYEDALEAASEFLRKLEIPAFRETYYVRNDNQCTINFSAVTTTQPQAICYPDLIKLTLELGQGALVEYDATGYLMNHHERQIKEPSLTVEKAKENISPLLTVRSSQLAIIPSQGLYELVCWEYLCENEAGEKFLIYLNGETGLEEQLYLLQENENGILVH